MKRRIAILVTTLVLSLVLGSVSAQTKIRVWTHQNNSFNTGLEALAASYMAEHPDITISFESFDYETYIQTLQTSIPAKTEADILQMFGTWTCSYKSNLATVPEAMIGLDAAREKFFAASINGYVCDEQVYGFPQEFNIEYGAALVNTQMAADAGVDISKGWSNWDDFKADAKAMTLNVDGNVLTAGYNYTSGDSIGYSFLSLLKQYGGDYLNADGTAFTINTPEGAKALALMQSFVAQGIIDPVLFNDESNWVGDCMFEGACAMGVVGPWVIPEYAVDFPDLAAQMQYVKLPTINNDSSFVADSGWGLTVSANSKVQDAAWDFVKYVALNDANALAWNTGSGTLPAIKANTKGEAAIKLVEAYPHFAPFLDILENGQYVGTLPDRDLFWYDILYPHILGVLQGVEDPEVALSAIETEANESFQ